MTRLQHVRILYKTILRLHNGLPVELRGLGNEYARDEFKKHKKCEDSEALPFLAEWTDYAFKLNHQLTEGGNMKSSRTFGDNIEANLLDEMRDEQVMQLYELMKAAKAQDNEEKI